MAHSQENTENNSESLPYPLDEFREALRQEITAAKQNVSNTAVPLKYGRKLSSQGAAYQYAFQLETILNTPDGTPADLLIPGKETLSATIVSFQGLQLILSVEKDFGPFIPEASLQTDLTFLLRKLIERIEQNSENINPAAARMLGKKTVTGTPQSPRESFIWENHTQLSDDQMRALHSALGRDLTVIWGPPGTGKTHTIGTITEQLFALGRTVLIVSHTNTAVDQAIKHVANSMNQYLENGAVIRIGEVKDSELNTQFPDVLIKQQVERQSQALIQEKEKLNSKRESIAESIDSVQEKIAIYKIANNLWKLFDLSFFTMYNCFE